MIFPPPLAFLISLLYINNTHLRLREYKKRIIL